MLCYRCGSYNADDARKCTVCSAPLSAPRRKSPRTGRSKRGAGRAPFEAGHVLQGRYRLIDAVAQGTTGWIFRATDEDEWGDVAVKVIASNLLQTDSERAHFAKTLKSAKRVHHGNVARVLEDGRERGHAFYVMPYLEGLTLRKIIDLRIEKKQVFAASEVMPLISQIAQACDAWGRFGYHGAIRPSSVMVLPDVLKVTGLPHLQGLPRKPFVVFQQQSGNVHYLAPECRRDDAIVDRRADVYSMGVIVGEMLTGAVYGSDERTWKRAEAGMPASLLAVLHTALAENPEARFESGQAFFEALANIVDGFADTVPQAPSVPVGDSDSEDVALGPTQLRVTGDKPQKVISSRRRDRTPSPGRGAGGMLTLAAVLVLAAAAVAGARWYSYLQKKPPALAADTGAVSGAPEDEEAVRPAAKRRALASAREGRTPKPEPGAERASSAPEPEREAVEPDPAVSPIPRPDPKRKVASVRDAPKSAKQGARTPELALPRARPRNNDPEPEPEPVVASLQPVEEPPLAPPPPPDPAKRRGCPPDMIRIESGRFLMGTQPNDPMRGFGDLQVRYRNTEAYCIDRYEFPNQKGVRPLTGVSFRQAKRSCEAQGKRLCSEVEWERACKGPNNARFPFGNAFRAGACNVENGGRAGLTGAHAGCTSGYGVVDMSGNVAEWTASRWSSEIPDRVVKGGAADQAMHASRCSARINEVSSARGQQLGFRCCASLE